MNVGDKVRVISPFSRWSGFTGAINRVRRYPGSIFPVEVLFLEDNRLVSFDYNELEVIK